MGNKIGRRKSGFPTEKYKLVINTYLHHNPGATKISYLGISKYAKELFDNNLIDILIPHHYWKNDEGKSIVDSYNDILNSENNMSPSETIVSSRDIINRYSTDDDRSRKKMISALEMNEKKLNRYIEQNNKQNQKIQELELELEKIKVINETLYKKIDYYENTLFQWLELSNKRDIPLINMFSVGKTKNKFTEQFLKDLFTENPFDLFNQLISLKNNFDTDKTIDLNKKRQEKSSLLDDFDF